MSPNNVGMIGGQTKQCLMGNDLKSFESGIRKNLFELKDSNENFSLDFRYVLDRHSSMVSFQGLKLLAKPPSYIV